MEGYMQVQVDSKVDNSQGRNKIETLRKNMQLLVDENTLKI